MNIINLTQWETNMALLIIKNIISDIIWEEFDTRNRLITQGWGVQDR